MSAPFFFIPASSGRCSPAQTQPLLVNRYCGPFLNTQAMGSNHIPICGEYKDTTSSDKLKNKIESSYFMLITSIDRT